MTEEREDNLAFYGRACKVAHAASVVAVIGLILTPVIVIVNTALDVRIPGYEIRYGRFGQIGAWLFELLTQMLSKDISGYVLLLVAAVALRVLARLAARDERASWAPESSDVFVRHGSTFALAAIAIGAVVLLTSLIIDASYFVMSIRRSAMAGMGGASVAEVRAVIVSQFLSGLVGSLRNASVLIVAGFAVMALLRISQKTSPTARETEEGDGVAR